MAPRRRARIDAENDNRRVTSSRLRIIKPETQGFPTGYLRVPPDTVKYNREGGGTCFRGGGARGLMRNARGGPTPLARAGVLGGGPRPVKNLKKWPKAGSGPKQGYGRYTKAPPAWLGGGIARSDTNPHPGPLPLGRRAGGPPRRRVTEPTNRRARKRQENKPTLSTLIARIVPGAVRECDVPVPPCSAFRLLSSLSYSHAWPFAVAKATQVCTRNRTSPVAVEESPSSRDPTTRPLRRSPRHP